jgi:hypothetical protein
LTNHRFFRAFSVEGEVFMPTVSVSAIPGFQPLDTQFASDEKRSFPEALAPLWHSADRVFVLLDGAKIPHLAEMLEAADIAHVCLFDGELEGLAAAAPWLARLPLDHRLMRALFTAEGPAHMALWPSAAMLIIESDMPLVGLRKHLRRFLRVADAAGKMHFFRFWEAATCAAYFASVGDDDALTTRWFCAREGGRIARLLVPDVQAGALQVIVPEGLPAEAGPPHGPFTLRDADHFAMARARLMLDVAAMVALLAETFPERMEGADKADTDAFARKTLSRMHDYGFAQKDHLFMLLAWELHYGPNFENRDPDGYLRQVCEAALPEGEKFALLEERVATFE